MSNPYSAKYASIMRTFQDKWTAAEETNSLDLSGDEEEQTTETAPAIGDVVPAERLSEIAKKAFSKPAVISSDTANGSTHADTQTKPAAVEKQPNTPAASAAPAAPKPVPKTPLAQKTVAKDATTTTPKTPGTAGTAAVAAAKQVIAPKPVILASEPVPAAKEAPPPKPTATNTETNHQEIPSSSDIGVKKGTFTLYANDDYVVTIKDDPPEATNGEENTEAAPKPPSPTVKLAPIFEKAAASPQSKPTIAKLQSAVNALATAGDSSSSAATTTEWTLPPLRQVRPGQRPGTKQRPPREIYIMVNRKDPNKRDPEEDARLDEAFNTISQEEMKVILKLRDLDTQRRNAAAEQWDRDNPHLAQANQNAEKTKTAAAPTAEVVEPSPAPTPKPASTVEAAPATATKPLAMKPVIKRAPAATPPLATTTTSSAKVTEAKSEPSKSAAPPKPAPKPAASSTKPPSAPVANGTITKVRGHTGETVSYHASAPTRTESHSIAAVTHAPSEPVWTASEMEEIMQRTVSASMRAMFEGLQAQNAAFINTVERTMNTMLTGAMTMRARPPTTPAKPSGGSKRSHDARIAKRTKRAKREDDASSASSSSSSSSSSSDEFEMLAEGSSDEDAVSESEESDDEDENDDPDAATHAKQIKKFTAVNNEKLKKKIVDGVVISSRTRVDSLKHEFDDA